MDNNNLRSLHKTLQKAGYNPPAYEQFARDMEDDNNLRGVYSTLKKEGYTPPAYDQFKNDMGFGKQAAAPAAPAQQRQAQPPTQQGVRQVRQQPAAVNARQTGTRQPQPQQRRQATTKKKKQPYRPSAQQWAATQNMFRQSDAMFANFRQRSANMREWRKQNPLRFRGDGLRLGARQPRVLGGNKNVVRGQDRFNPRTGKMEARYITPSGDEFSTEIQASNFQNRVEHAQYRQEHPLDADMQDAYKERDRLDREIARRTEELNQKNREHDMSFAETLAVAEGPGYYRSWQQERLSDPELSMLWTAKRKNEQRIKTLEREKGQDGFWKTLGKTLFSFDTWDFGMQDLHDAINLMSYSDHKMPKGAMDKAQQAMMENTYLAQEADKRWGENDTFMQRAGEITGQAIPFVVEFMATGGFEGVTAAGTKLGSRAAARWATGKVGRWVLKNTGTLAGDMAAGFLMANTTGAMNTAADIINRHQGYVVMDENGDYKFEGGKSWGRSIYEGEMANTLEYYTEKLGVHLDGGGKIVGSWLGKGMERIGAGRVSELLSRITGSEWSKATGQLLRRGGIQDYPGEVIEEEANLILNSLLVGDNKFSDLVDGKTQADIWGGMLLSIGFMQSPGTIGGVHDTAQYYRYKHNTDKSDRLAGFRLTADKWEPWRERIDNTNNADMMNVVTDVLGDENLSPQEKEAVMGYVGNLMKMRGYNLRTTADAKDQLNAVDEDGNPILPDPEVTAVNEAFRDGYNMDDDAEMQDARNRMVYLHDQLTEFVSDDMMSQFDNDPMGALSAIRDNEQWNNDEKQAALDYVNARTIFNGMVQRVRDDIDTEIAASDAMIDSRVFRGAANPTADEEAEQAAAPAIIIPATLKERDENENDKQVYIVSGNVQMLDDGTMVDTENSDQNIVVVDADSGKVSMISINDILRVEEALDAEQVKEEARNDIVNVMSKQASDKIDGNLPFMPGDNYMMMYPDDSSIHNVQIAEDLGDGTVSVLLDDAQEPTVMSKEDIQGFADKYRIDTLQAEDAVMLGDEDEEQAEDNTPDYALNDVVSLQTDEGTVRGQISNEANEDGLIEVYTEKPIGGKKINLFTREQLNNMLVDRQPAAQPVTQPAPESNAGLQADVADTFTETPAPVAENEMQPADIEAGTEEPQQPAEPMPMREVGTGKNAETEPDWLAVTPERGHDWLFGESGLDRADANEIVKNNLEAAQKAVEKASKLKPKKTTNPFTLQAERERIAGEQAAAQNALDYWRTVQSRQTALRNAELEQSRAEQAERDRIAHEQAVADEAVRQAEVLAQREEQAQRGAHAVHPAIRERWDAAPKIEGFENEITLPNGERVQGRYMLVESGAATPSHNVNMEFTRSEGFPVDENGNTVNDRDYERDKDAQGITREMGRTYDSRAIQSTPVVSKDGVVLSGNGRTMAGELAARDNTDGAYLDHLTKFGRQFGFTAEQVGAMQHPRVVFVPDADMPYTTETFAKFNAQDMKGQNRTEQAVKMGKVVDDATFGRIVGDINRFDTLAQFYNDPKASVEAINDLRRSGVITPMQYGEMFDGSKVSGTGRQMLENMLIGKAFESNPDTIRQLAEFPALRQSVVAALAEISNNKRLGEDYSLESELAEAIYLAYQALKSGYKQGEPVSQFARQLNLFPFDMGRESVADYTNATIMMLADVLNSTEVNKLKKVLAMYNHRAAESAAGQMDLFSGEVTTKEQIIKEVLAILNYGTKQEQQAAVAEAVERRKAEAQPTGSAGVQQDGATERSDSGSAGAERSEGSEKETPSLTHDEAISLIAEMEERAELAPDIELTIENWDALFGEEGHVLTPIGEVKMGENQFTKLMRQGREGKLGMIKPTLENPDVIIEDASEAKDGDVAERKSSYIFVKAFKKADGSRYYYFTSITVSKDGKEVVVSSQEKSRNRLLRLMTEGKILWRTPKDATTASVEQQGLDYAQPSKTETATKGSGMTPQSIDMSPSGGKVSAKDSDMQAKGEKKKTWLLTMFEKKNSALDNTTDTGKTLSSNGNDTATPESTVVSVGKGSEEDSSVQEKGEKNAGGEDMLSGRPIQGLEGRSEADVLSRVRGHIEEVLSSEGGVGVTLKGMALHGSRMRGDAREDSDLDVVVEYSGDMREDDLFNLLHDAPMEIDGVTVDINPIKEGKSGTLERYMERSRQHDVLREAEAATNTEPTDAQKEAGNYKKGHIKLDGFDISIEQPKGSTRSGRDASGKEWSVTMQNTYGYIRGTEGVDGDHIDVFLSDNMDVWNGTVYVIDQVKADGSFDEHKVMYGFNSAEEAAAAYNSNYSEGWQGLGTITGVSKEEFKKWIGSSHRKTKPFAEYKNVKVKGEQAGTMRQPTGQTVDGDIAHFHKETDSSGRTAIDEANYNADDLVAPLLVDGKKSHIGITQIVPDDINEPTYTRAYYDYAHLIDPKTNKGWQAVGDKIDEWNASHKKDEQGFDDGDSPQVRFPSVDAALKFAEWFEASTSHQEQRGAGGVLPSAEEVALRDGLVEVLRGTGIEVVTDAEEGQRVLDAVNGRVQMQRSQGESDLSGISDADLDKEYLTALDVVEKPSRIEKLRNSAPVNITKADYDGKYALNASDAQSWIKDNLRGEHTIKDTGEKILISKVGAEEVTSHSRYDDAHLKSISSIPRMLEDAIFIEEQASTKPSSKFDSFRYYVVGLTIDGVDYTAKIVIGVKQGKKYYDHRLTQMEKTKLIDFVNQPASGFTTAGNASLPPYTGSKDSKLVSLLQTKAEEIAEAEAKMRDILDEMKRRRGYSDDSSYQGTSAFNGAAPARNAYFPTREERVSAFDNGEMDGDANLGDFMDAGLDLWDLGWQINDPRSYRVADEERREAIRNLREVVNGKKKTVTMYRSIPSSVKEESFRNGDWITPSRRYAEENAEIHGWGDEFRIIEQEVPVDDVWWDGNDIAEWGYDNSQGEVYKNTANNRKSDDLVTRDDEGNVILPSQRYDERKGDIRYFRTADGTAYGFVKDSKIYIDPKIATSETPIHEYSHLWSEALEQANPESWTHLKGQLTKDQELVDFVRGLYPEIYDENELMHEVFSQFSGKRGKQRLEQLRDEEVNKTKGIAEKARIFNIFHKLAALLKGYWEMARDLFAGNNSRLKKMSAEDFADMALNDLLRGFNPKNKAKNVEAATVKDPFYSNAERAVEGIKQNKATAEQWKAMLTKAGGIKAGEDKWMGLSEWFYENRGKSLTKDEVLQFIRDNGIEMEETTYSEAPQSFDSLKREYDQWLHDEGFDYAQEQLRERFGDDADIAFDDLGGELVIANEKAAAALLGSDDIINQTRLDYTTEGLENKREIAFVVPDVEPYQEYDSVHFGPENKGKAVMWVRFGETTDADGNRVLVIDEIQSNRHQDAREKGYRERIDREALEEEEKRATNNLLDYRRVLRERYENDNINYILNNLASTDEIREYRRLQGIRTRIDNQLVEWGTSSGVPAAPFERNWHEVAMKRMLRLAAEEGFDKVAWTTGEQQAERYGIGGVVESITKGKTRGENTLVSVQYKNGKHDSWVVAPDGKVVDGGITTGENLSDLIGKELSEKVMSLDEDGSISGDGLRIGGEGMKGFYDQMLPRFMDKYGKKWGVKTGEVQLSTPGNEVMHSVDVTAAMRRSVLEQGQPLFQKASDGGLEAVKDEVLNYFHSAVAGNEHGKGKSIGKLTASGRAYLESISGLKLKEDVDFVLNPSDLRHIHKGHYGANEKDNGNNVPLTDVDIRSMVEVIKQPDKVVYFIDSKSGNKIFFFFKKNDKGTYNLAEVYADKHGNLTAKSYYNTKKSISQRVDELQDSPHTTSMTTGAFSSSGAKVPILFDVAKENGENVVEDTAKYRIREDEPANVRRTMQEDRDMMRSAVQQMGEKLHTDINIIEDVNEITHPNAAVQERRRKSKGWYDPSTGEVVIIVPNNNSVADVEATVLHEIVGHKGLRELFGKDFDTFLSNVFDNVDDETRRKIVERAMRNGWDFRKATEEYLASLAESTDFENEVNRSAWQKIKDFFMELLRKAGVRLSKPLTDADLRYILWRSYQRRVEQGAMGVAEDVVMRERLGIDNSSDEHLYRELDDMTDEEIKEHLHSIKTRHGLKSRSVIAVINNEGDLERLRGKIDDEDFVAVKEKYYNPHIYGCADKQIGMIYLFPHKQHTIEDVESTWWHESVHIVWDRLDLDDKEELGRTAFDYLKKNDSYHYNMIIEGKYSDNEIPEEATCRLVQHIIGKYGTEAFLSAKMGGSNEKVAKLAEILQYYFKNGEEKTNDYLRGLRADNSRGIREGEGSREGQQSPRLGRTSVSGWQNIDSRGAERIGSSASGSWTNGGRITDQYGSEEDDINVDNYEAGRTTFEESITNGLLKVAGDTRAALSARVSAMRALGGNLNKLRQAMARQREYDRATVDSIVRLARLVINSGYFKDLSNYEVRRLMSLINRAAGREDITRQADAVVDMLLNHQLNECAAMLKKQLAVKGSKINSKGVEVQGELDITGQRMVAALKSGLRLDEQALAERISETMQRMGSDDEVVAQNAATEYQGLLLADRYMQDIRKSEIEETGLREEMRLEQEKIYDFRREPVTDDAGNTIMRLDGTPRTRELRTLKPEFRGTVSEENKRVREEVQQFIKATEDAIRQNRLERVTCYAEMMVHLGDGLRQSVQRAKDWRDAQQAHVNEIHHNANSDLNGVPVQSQGVLPQGGLFATNVNNDVLRLLFAPMATFEKLLRYFGSKAYNGEGYLFNRFMRGWIDASDREWRKMREAHKALDERVSDVFGKDMKWSDLFELERSKDYPRIEVSYWDGDERVTSELTQGEALYIYMVNKMNDGQMKLRRMGITEEDVEAIRRALDPRFIELGDWLQNTFLKDKRKEYNDVYERMFGAPMAAIENYFPLKIQQRDLVDTSDITQRDNGHTTPSTMTGSVIKRTRNAKPLKIHANAFDVVLEHIQDMEHWAAFAEFNRDLNTLRHYKRFKNRVLNMSSVEFGAGQELWKAFDDACAIAAGEYHPSTKRGSGDNLAVNLAKGFTTSCISFRTYTALKQLLSMPAFWNGDASLKELAKYTNPVGAYKAWNWAMENLPGFSKRWESRQVGDVRLMDTDSDYGFWRNRKVRQINRAGMFANASIDALTVAMGANAVFETRKKRYLDFGYSEEQAERRALQDASINYNSSQQSSENAFLSGIQLDRTWWTTTMTIFRSASMGYQRRLLTALRNLKYRARSGYKDESIEFMRKQMVRDGLSDEQALRAAQRIYNQGTWRSLADMAIYGFVLPFFWNLGPYMVYLLMGDDDDDKLVMLEDALRHSLLGPVEGLTGGQIWSELGNNMMNGENVYGREYGNMPMTDFLRSIIHKWGNDNPGIANDIVNLLVQSGLGVNVQTFSDMVVGILDACDGEPETSREATLLFLRVLQVPQSQLDDIYFDELGMSARKAQQLSAEDMAKRYAYYKLHHSNPLFGWSYNEEQEKKIVDKYTKRFTDKINEHLDSKSDEELFGYKTNDEVIANEVLKLINKRVPTFDDEKLNLMFKSDNETLRRKARNEKASRLGGTDSYGSSDAAYNQIYVAMSEPFDEDEDVLLQVAKKQAKDAGDDARYKALDKAQQELTTIKKGKHTKSANIPGLGEGDDDKVMEQLRTRRREILKEFGITPQQTNR